LLEGDEGLGAHLVGRLTGGQPALEGVALTFQNLIDPGSTIGKLPLA
jgi:hypothetical protein